MQRDERPDIARTIAENATAGLFMVDGTGRCTYMNPAAERMSGYSAAEVLGFTLHEVMHHTREDGSPYPPEECPLTRTLDEHHVVRDHRDRFIRKGGTFFDVSCSASPILENGVRTGTVIEVRDTTAERSTEDVLRLHSLILDRMSDGVSMADEQGVIVYTNAAEDAMFGYEPGELLGQHVTVQNAYPPEENERRVTEVIAQLRTSGIWNGEWHNRRKDGSTFFTSSQITAIDLGGRPHWVCVQKDITEERELQRQLESERLRLREIFNRAPAFIATLHGPAHVFEYVNPLFKTMIGERDVIGLAVRDALPEVEGQGFFELLDQVYTTGEPFSGKGMLIRLARGGRVEDAFVNFIYEPIYSGDAIGAVFVHGNEVTDHIRAQRELESALAELQYQGQLNKTITDNAGSCLFMMDERGHPTFMNPAAEEVTGYRLDEIRNAPLHEAVHHHHADGRPYPISDCPIDNGREQLKPLKDYRDVFVRKDGTFFPVSCYVAPIQRDGRNRGAVLEFRDITDDLRAEDALRDADRRKDEFLATLSHELRTPLTAILGWARLLQMGWTDEEMLHTAIDTIEKSARVQAQIVDDVLDLSRIIAGKIRVESETVDVADVAANALEGIRLAASAKEIRVTSHLPERDEAVILGDANRLQQVIWNLLVNAIKFTPQEGSVELEVSRRDGTVAIRVTDSGIGIRPEFLPHVFDAFRQAESSATRVHGGLGLGLSIVRHLVQLHGGTVTAESDGDGHGATFVVELPRLRRTGVPATQPVTNGVDPDLADLRGRSVLVIDDQQAVRDYMVTVLRRCGANTREAADVAQAMRAVQDELPDAILCDLAMPHADGYAFLEWLRSIPWPRRIPIVAVTAFGRPEDRDRALAAGFDAYVRKPIQPGALSQAVNAALR